MKCDMCHKNIVSDKNVDLTIKGIEFHFCGKTCSRQIREGKALIINDKLYYRWGKRSFDNKGETLQFISALIKKNYSLNGKSINEINLPDAEFYGVQWVDAEEKVISYTTKPDVFKTYS